ncbi:hypothetical protein [Actinokineospora sp. NBRC 105648]|uniref:hypothetical protein n=1 Tax=Actinokineospora sp. NBRC 105648 TaxID=3032206 RepID=UPI0024A21D41|nr:hypothetical protein [Actinokineospora sp. NBRC 105648]GLZ39402.1 hypothetical protein Acsp05_30260 [Actinokineospora sp. NBRC 105648]
MLGGVGLEWTPGGVRLSGTDYLGVDGPADELFERAGSPAEAEALRRIAAGMADAHVPVFPRPRWESLVGEARRGRRRNPPGGFGLIVLAPLLTLLVGAVAILLVPGVLRQPLSWVALVAFLGCGWGLVEGVQVIRRRSLESPVHDLMGVLEH